MKKITSLILALSLIISSFVYFPTQAEAFETNVSINAKYNGNYDSDTPMEFSIYNINIREGTFYGRIIIEDASEKIYQNVIGTVHIYPDHYVCDFSFTYTVDFIIVNMNYDANFTIDVYPFEGVAKGSGGGGILFGLDEFVLHGTVDEFYNKTFSYNENDMKMCMELSAAMYRKSKESDIIDIISDTVYPAYADTVPTNIVSFYYTKDGTPDSPFDTDINNSPFAILNRVNDDSIDLIVSIRGTYLDEWQGNVQLTGDSYNPNQTVHYSFENAKNSIKDKIMNYYNEYCKDYDNVNLIITGHSRGAAVANLYAKEATDVMDGVIASVEIPKFDKVTAYTFACPNVVRINSENTVKKLESYTNIYNFGFDTDIVPTVPLTSPTDGWNYWKYGTNYLMSLHSAYEQKISTQFYKDDSLLYYNGPINYNINKNFQLALLKWPTVESYYEPFLVNTISGYSESLYDFLSNDTFLLTEPKTMLGLYVINEALFCPQLLPVFLFGIINFSTIKKSHDWKTYYEVITKYGTKMFYRYSYVDSISSSIHNKQNIYSIYDIQDQNSNTEYNANEINSLKQFALLDDNEEKLGWDLEEPSTWNGVVWDDEGHIVSLDFTYKWLTGTFDCSAFTELESLNLYANSLSSININNEKLVSLNCSFNDLSQNGIDLSQCPILTELYCDGCGISTINLAGLTDLQTLSCAFNNLIALDVENNNNLDYICCSYNYLDVHEGGTLKDSLNNYESLNGAYINCHPQMMTENAVVDTNEIQALENFAKVNNNNEELNWLDDNGNIAIDKVQNNVYFEFDGGKYRVVALDVSKTDVEGSLDLSSFGELKAIYCEETKVTLLDVSGCDKLETLWCEGCKITTLELPSNAGESTSLLRDVSCEYNYIDTHIFTEKIISNIESKTDYNLKYVNQKGDSSALQAALNFANKLEEKDYSASTYEILKELLDECNYYNFDNLYLTQDDIDSLTSDILTAVYNLKAYFKVDLSSPNGNMNIEYAEPDFSNDNSPIELPYLDDEEVSVDNALCSLLYGTRITLYVTPKDGYSFVGWYDTTNNRYLSRNSQYSFKVDSNVNLKAVIVPDGSATLTFSNYSNWIAGTVTKTTLEWAEITTINDLLPDVPYRYGYSNGRWVYDESDVIAKLQAGEDVTVGAEYDNDNTSLPTPRTATDKPALDLYYSFDEDNSVGSFVMASGFPENIQVESIGMAFYYRSASVFDPTDNFTLLLNNKMLVSRFNAEELDDIYITNIKNMSATNNWSARGFVTYYDTNGNLVTEYSNQVNIINKNSC